MIRYIDTSDFSESQLDQWYETWNSQVGDLEDMQLTLQCLNATLETKKAKSDRPLFQLPQEVRVLVRAELTHTLGTVATH